MCSSPPLGKVWCPRRAGPSSPNHSPLCHCVSSHHSRYRSTVEVVLLECPSRNRLRTSRTTTRIVFCVCRRRVVGASEGSRPKGEDTSYVDPTGPLCSTTAEVQGPFVLFDGPGEKRYTLYSSPGPGEKRYTLYSSPWLVL